MNSPTIVQCCWFASLRLSAWEQYHCKLALYPMDSVSELNLWNQCHRERSFT